MCEIDTTQAIEILRENNIEIGFDPRTPVNIVCDLQLLKCASIDAPAISPPVVMDTL